MKLTVTCVCGKEVAVPKQVAGAILAQSRTGTRDPEELSKTGKKAARARWKGHKKVKKV